LHRYYTCCEQLDDSAIEEILPEAEGVPEGLNFQDAPESPAQKSLSLTQIVDWLRECRHECEFVARSAERILAHCFFSYTIHWSDSSTVVCFQDWARTEPTLEPTQPHMDRDDRFGRPLGRD